MDAYTKALNREGSVHHEDTPVGSASFAERNKESHAKAKEDIKAQIGEQQFTEIYEFLKYHRQKQTDEDQVQQEIKYMTNGNRALMASAFQIDCIIFKELLQ